MIFTVWRQIFSNKVWSFILNSQHTTSHTIRLLSIYLEILWCELVIGRYQYDNAPYDVYTKLKPFGIQLLAVIGYYSWTKSLTKTLWESTQRQYAVWPMAKDFGIFLTTEAWVDGSPCIIEFVICICILFILFFSSTGVISASHYCRISVGDVSLVPYDPTHAIR